MRARRIPVNHLIKKNHARTTQTKLEFQVLPLRMEIQGFVIMDRPGSDTVPSRGLVHFYTEA